MAAAELLKSLLGTKVKRQQPRRRDGSRRFGIPGPCLAALHRRSPSRCSLAPWLAAPGSIPLRGGGTHAPIRTLSYVRESAKDKPFEFRRLSQILPHPRAVTRRLGAERAGRRGEIWGRCGEMCARCGRDVGEMWATYGGLEVQIQVYISPLPPF